MSAHRQQQHSSRSAPYPAPHHHHPHIHNEVSKFEDGLASGLGISTARRKNSRQPPPPDEASFLPSNDRNEWYYPVARYPGAGDESEDELDGAVSGERSEEALQASRSGQGNWGNKLVKGSRWMRRGKIVAWGPHKPDWDMDDKARKRLRRVMPRSRSPTPEPPTLPHLRRSSTPPLTASYTSVPALTSRDFTSLILDPSVQHTFTSTHLGSLQDTATELIAGEAATRKAFGALWRILQGDLQRRDRDHFDSPEDEDDDAEDQDLDERERDIRMSLRRSRRDPNLAEVPPLSNLFVSPVPVALGSGGNPSVPAPGSNGPNASGTERFISPQSQLETFEWCLGVMRELADHGKEYLSRLEEIRNGLGEAGATRAAVWRACRKGALDELVDGRTH